MLSIEDIVKINIFIGSAAMSSNVFDVGLILGPAETIPAATRVSEYTSLAAMAAAGFATDSAEYLAATKYFGANPAPGKVLIGRINENEAPLAALTACIEKNPSFDGIYFCAAANEQLAAVATYLDTLDRYHLWYSVAGTAADSVATFTTMKNTGSRRLVGLYSTEAHAGAAAMGTICGLLHRNANSAIQACYSTIASLTPTDMTHTQMTAIKDVNGNVYVSRRGKGLFEQGATAHGMRIDDSIYLDMMRSEIQDALFELITSGSGRLPQVDSTTALMINAAAAVLERYAGLGIIAAGKWTGSPIATIDTGDMLDKGYVLYADSYSEQSMADKIAHKAMPITVGLILGGSVESVEMSIYAQQ